MAAAQLLKLEWDAVRAIGLAGLLHDIGMVRLPTELLNKNEQLSDVDRDMLMRHTAEGAAIILEAESAPDVVAVAAYEHHVRPDGAGYPTLTYPRSAHRVSRLIAVCSGYHALTSARPFRGAWKSADALTIIEAASGRDYDSEMVGLITSLLRNAEAEPAQGS
jgi:HD-GYP domain-containing protein (c-di-GMP phosphodiesterase class II)